MKRILALIALFFCATPGFSAAVQLSYAKGRVVNLGSASLIRVVEGQLLVENVAPDKQVWVHYSQDHGPWQKVAAYYVEPNADKVETWKFSINAEAIPYQSGQYPAMNVEFAIELVTSGGRTWDNNGGAGYNYRISSPGQQPEYGLVELGSAPLMLEYAQYRNEPWPAYANTFSGSLILKNLSYEKKVQIHYSTDDWQTVQTVNAVYSQPAGPSTERWYFYTLLGKNNRKALKFYLSFETAGLSYFDSRFGANYSVEFDSRIDWN